MRHETILSLTVHVTDTLNKNFKNMNAMYFPSWEKKKKNQS